MQMILLQQGSFQSGLTVFMNNMNNMNKFNIKGKYKSKWGVQEYEVFVENEIGGFEISLKDDEESYEEGRLWFDGKTLVDYDGVYCLDEAIIDCLERNGFDVQDMKENLEDEW